MPTAALLLALLLAPAGAGARLMEWEGTLGLDLLDPSLEPPALTGGGVAVVWPDTAPALVTLRLRGGLGDTTALPVTDPDTPALAAVVLSASLGIGTLGPFQPPAPFTAPQLGSATLPLAGALRLCFLTPDCTSGALDVPLASPGGAAGVGVGGVVTAGGAGALRLSLEGAPWTVRTAWLPVGTAGGGSVSLPAFGFAHGPASFTGSTATTGGTLQLVTPIAVRTNQGLDPSGFGALRIRFVPEPGAGLLLGSGLGALVLLARRKARAQESA